MTFAEFAGSASARRRYWAGSLRGWPRVRDARPNAAHLALARLEAAGRVARLVTQNVDGLHQRAGSRRPVDLHGRLDAVECLECGASLARDDVQALLTAWNPSFVTAAAAARPDGDAGRRPGPRRASACPTAASAAACSSRRWCSSAKTCRARVWRTPWPRSPRRRAPRRGVVADGVFRVPVRARGRAPGHARGGGEPGAHARRRPAAPEAGSRLRLRAAGRGGRRGVLGSVGLGVALLLAPPGAAGQADRVQQYLGLAEATLARPITPAELDAAVLSAAGVEDVARLFETSLAEGLVVGGAFVTPELGGEATLDARTAAVRHVSRSGPPGDPPDGDARERPGGAARVPLGVAGRAAGALRRRAACTRCCTR